MLGERTRETWRGREIGGKKSSGERWGHEEEKKNVKRRGREQNGG